jgi:hypothetical protein
VAEPMLTPPHQPGQVHAGKLTVQELRDATVTDWERIRGFERL